MKHTFGSPSIDLFTTRVNTKCKYYNSWFKDPDGLAIDAFTVPWNNLDLYAFPFLIYCKSTSKDYKRKSHGYCSSSLLDLTNLVPPVQTIID